MFMLLLSIGVKIRAQKSRYIPYQKLVFDARMVKKESGTLSKLANPDKK